MWTWRSAPWEAFTPTRKTGVYRLISNSPWGTEITSFQSLRKKMTEYLRWREAVTTPYTDRQYQQKPKVTATNRHSLVTFTRSSEDTLWQTRKVTVEPHPESKTRTLLETMRKKELEAAEYRLAHAKPAFVSADKSPKSSFSPKKDYCAVCTPLGRSCTSEFPGCQDWKDYEEDGSNQDWRRVWLFRVFGLGCRSWGTRWTKVRVGKQRCQWRENTSELDSYPLR